MVKCSRILNHEILFIFDLFTSIDPSTRSLSCRNVSITQPSGWWWTRSCSSYASPCYSLASYVSFSIRTHFWRGWSGSIHNGGPCGLSKGPHNRRDHCVCSLPVAGMTWHEHQQALGRLLSGHKFHFLLLYTFSRIRTSSSSNQATPYSWNFPGKRWAMKDKSFTRFS